MSASRRGIAVASVVVTACASAGTVRPGFPPLYEAVVDTLRVVPVLSPQLEQRILEEQLDALDSAVIERAQLIAELEQRTIDEGLEVRVANVQDAYLETRWFNVVSRRSGDGDVAHPEREILLRFWVDPAGPLGYKLTAEAVYRRVSDPSLPSRELEVMVPEDHEGEAILTRILDGVRERFSG
jgi:hypothetical protein